MMGMKVSLTNSIKTEERVEVDIYMNDLYLYYLFEKFIKIMYLIFDSNPYLRLLYYFIAGLIRIIMFYKYHFSEVI